MYIGDTNIEVTQKELIIAIIFALISIGIGFYVGNRMGIWQDEHNAKYNQAVKIDNDSTQFAYAFKTDAGHTLSYGTAEAIGSVTDNNIPGQYMSIHRVLEVYTMQRRAGCPRHPEGARRRRHPRRRGGGERSVDSAFVRARSRRRAFRLLQRERNDVQ